MEEAVIHKEPVLPAPVRNCREASGDDGTHEHHSAGNALGEMRKAGSDFRAPADACASYRTLYKALAACEADLHQHIHLENNILFPRAIAMEKAH